MIFTLSILSVVLAALLVRMGSEANREAARAEAWGRFETDFR